MERADIDYEKYAVCLKPKYQSIDGTLKACLAFTDDEGTLFLAPKEDMLEIKESPKETTETYSVIFGTLDAFGNVYAKETLVLTPFENMKKHEIIIDYIIDDKGVKVIK